MQHDLKFAVGGGAGIHGTLSKLSTSLRLGAVPMVWYLIQPAHNPGCQSAQGPMIQFFGTVPATLGMGAEVKVSSECSGAPKLSQPLEPT